MCASKTVLCIHKVNIKMRSGKECAKAQIIIGISSPISLTKKQNKLRFLDLTESLLLESFYDKKKCLSSCSLAPPSGLWRSANVCELSSASWTFTCTECHGREDHPGGSNRFLRSKKPQLCSRTLSSAHLLKEQEPSSAQLWLCRSPRRLANFPHVGFECCKRAVTF